MSFVPWLVMATGSSASGLLSDSLVRSGVNPTTVRKVVQTVAFLGPILPLLALAAGGLGTTQAVVAMTLALGITSVGQFVTNMSDIAPRQAGKLFGLCNTFGTFSGILGVSGEAVAPHVPCMAIMYSEIRRFDMFCPCLCCAVAGFLVEKTGSFGLVFQITAAMNIIGALVWNAFCTAERQFD